MAPTWERLAVRALGSVETELEVLSRTPVSPTYQRVNVHVGGLFARRAPFPTMWLRLWFGAGGRSHQRAFTVVDPNPAERTCSLEFALHDGIASQWARNCQEGERIRASLLGSAPPWEPKRWGAGAAAHLGLGAEFHGETFLVGDPASLPAINSILDALPNASVQVWLEHRACEDARLPVRSTAHHTVRWVHRADGSDLSARLREHWKENPPQSGDRFWVAAEHSQTRELVAALRNDYAIARERISALAYWRELPASTR